MRTTIRMNNELARRVKELARRRGQTFTQMIEEAATTFLAKEGRRRAPAKLPPLPVAGDPRHRVSQAEIQRFIEEAESAYDIKQVALGHGLAGR